MIIGRSLTPLNPSKTYGRAAGVTTTRAGKCRMSVWTARMLRRDSDVVMEKLGREIGAIRPHERVELRMDRELSEHRRIVERLKHRPMQCGPEVDFTARPVTESEPHDMASDVTRLEDVVVHAVTPGERSA